MSFTHLHFHTEYSLLDGACKIKDAVNKAKEFGMEALAITDHGNMFGVIEFYKACKAAGINPLLGCEVYVAPYGTSCEEHSQKDSDDWNDARYNHLVLIAKNNEGYKNLCKICSIGWTKGFYYKPRVDMDVLRKYHEGIICSSACLAGYLPRALLAGNYDLAVKIAKEFQDIFGKDDFYVEIQDHGLEDQERTNPDLIKIANEIGAKVIATNDVHYLNKEDAKAQDVLLCIQTQKKLADTNRMKFETDEFYMKSEEEMRALFSYIPEAIDNTMEVARKCNVEIEFGRVKLPDYEIPKEFPDHSSYFRHLCYEGMKKRYGENPPKEYVDRLEYEISVITSMNFIGYYLIVWDYVNFAKTNGIPVGPGRGSGAGSIVAYCMGITNIDPMRYNLLFERFLNPERISMPDFDLDFCYTRRHEVLEYVTRKYGSERVSQIITFGTMAAKNSIRDVARVMDVSYAEADRIAKMVPGDPKMTIQKALKMNPEFASDYQNNPTTKMVVDMALKLEGTPRQASKHACGVLIADDDITEYAPLSTAEDKETGVREAVIQFPMTTLEELGLVKMDFLGLRTLTVIVDAVKAIKKNHGVDIDIDNIDPDDYPEVYQDLVEKGTVGVFQFESDGMVSMLKSMFSDVDRVNSAKTEEERKALGHEFFERLIAGISLYRPGPMEYIPEYIHGLQHPDEVSYDCPELEPILKDTYSVIVYQEQVMLIVRALAGYSMGRSDIIRKAMGKKKQDVMDREKEVFLYGNEKTRKEGEALVPGCVKNGISEQVALKIWDKMVKFAEYAFNKSHAACYAYIALQTAILKKYYPEEFMAATLTSVIGNNKKLPFYVNACQKTMGIPIETPDINESEAGFTPLEHGIRFGLEAIKSVGEVLSFEIINERKANGPYKSLFDFCTRLARNKGLNKNAIESLIKAGSFDFTGYNRAELLNAAPAIFDAAKKQADETSSGQISLFSMLSGDTDEYLCPEIKRMPDFPEETRLKHEREVTSLFISGHPLNRYSRAISEAGCVSIREIRKSFEAQDGRFSNKQSVNLAIVLYNVKKKATKKGTMMVNASIQDIDSEAQVTAFSKTLEVYDFLFKEDSILLAKASIDVKDEGEISFIINGLYVMPIDGSSEEDFAAFKKEVVPYKRNNKPQRVAAPVAPPVPKTKSSKYQPGLYLRVPTYDDMPRFIAALNTGRGQTAVFLYCEENKKMYYNPSLKVNINDPTLIKNIKENVRSKEDIKIIK